MADLLPQRQTLRTLRREYPFLQVGTLARTAGGRPVQAARLGGGRARVLAAGVHHANEWLTGCLLRALLERYCRAVREGGSFGGFDARGLFDRSTLFCVPVVNPDGAALVTGEIAPDSPEYRAADAIARTHPELPFPAGWKANLAGRDLNLGYPADWEAARMRKAEKGFDGPAPRDYPGRFPLEQPECAALAAFTGRVRPSLVLAWHTQGGEIYDDFQGYRPPGTAALTDAFAAASGYRAAECPADSCRAGYKDWFIRRFDRPGFTIEAGRGENPLPASCLGGLIRENEPILALALHEAV